MVQTGLQTIGVGPCCALWTICELGFCFVFCVLQKVGIVPWCALSNVCKDFVLCSQGKDDFVLWVVDVVVIGNGCRWKQNYHSMIVDENYDYYRQCWQCLHQRREQKHLLDGEVITNLFFSKSKGISSGHKECSSYCFVYNTIYITISCDLITGYI